MDNSMIRLCWKVLGVVGVFVSSMVSVQAQEPSAEVPAQEVPAQEGEARSAPTPSDVSAQESESDGKSGGEPMADVDGENGANVDGEDSSSAEFHSSEETSPETGTTQEQDVAEIQEIWRRLALLEGHVRLVYLENKSNRLLSGFSLVMTGLLLGAAGLLVEEDLADLDNTGASRELSESPGLILGSIGAVSVLAGALRWFILLDAEITSREFLDLKQEEDERGTLPRIPDDSTTREERQRYLATLHVLLGRGEETLELAAEDAQTRRYIGVGIQGGIGVGLIGLSFAFAEESSPSDLALWTPGLLFIGLSLLDAFQTSTAERAWARYENRTKRKGRPSLSALPTDSEPKEPLSFHVLPWGTRDGFGLGLIRNF